MMRSTPFLLGVLLLIGGVMAAGSPAQWTLLHHTPPAGVPTPAMPAVQRSDLLISGRHPTVLVIQGIEVPPGVDTCSSLAIDMPYLWRPSAAAAKGNTSLFPGRAHFYLWGGGAPGPPTGSATNALASIKETWIDGSIPPDVWQPMGIGPPGNGSTTSLLRLRYRHNTTITGSPGNTTTIYLGSFIELRGYGPSLVGWAGAANVSNGTTTPFRYVDVSGNFLYPNLNASAAQVLMTVAPTGTGKYTTPLGTNITSLAVTIYGLCNQSADGSGAAATVWPTGLPPVGVVVAPSPPPPVLPSVAPPVTAVTVVVAAATEPPPFPSLGGAGVATTPPILLPSTFVWAPVTILTPVPTEVATGAPAGTSTPPTTGGEPILPIDSLLTTPFVVGIFVTCAVLFGIIILVIWLVARRSARRTEQTPIGKLMIAAGDEESVALDEMGGDSGSYRDTDDELEVAAAPGGLVPIPLEADAPAPAPPTKPKKPRKQTLLEQAMPIDANPFGGGGGDNVV